MVDRLVLLGPRRSVSVATPWVRVSAGPCGPAAVQPGGTSCGSEAYQTVWERRRRLEASLEGGQRSRRRDVATSSPSVLKGNLPAAESSDQSEDRGGVRGAGPGHLTGGRSQRRDRCVSAALIHSFHKHKSRTTVELEILQVRAELAAQPTGNHSNHGWQQSKKAGRGGGGARSRAAQRA